MKKLSKYQQGGDDELMELFNQFASSVQDDDFQSGEDVYNEYSKLNPQQQQQFLSSISGGQPQPMQTGGYNKAQEGGENFFTNYRNKNKI